MVPAIQDLARGAQSFLKISGESQSMPEPERNGFQPGQQRPWPVSQNGLQNPVKFDHRLFIKNDVIHFIDGDPGFLQAIGHRPGGKAVVVLLAIEALFLRGGNKLPISNQGGRGIVKIAGNPQDDHAEHGFKEWTPWQPGFGTDRAGKKMSSGPRKRHLEPAAGRIDITGHGKEDSGTCAPGGSG